MAQSREAARPPVPQCVPGKDNFLGKAGKQSQTSPVSRQKQRENARGEPGPGAGRSKRKCLETALLCLVALSLHMVGGWEEGPAGRGLRDHPVQVGSPRPREGRQLSKAAQPVRNRVRLGHPEPTLGSVCWGLLPKCLGAAIFTSPRRPHGSLGSPSLMEKQHFW